MLKDHPPFLVTLQCPFLGVPLVKVVEHVITVEQSLVELTQENMRWPGGESLA